MVAVGGEKCLTESFCAVDFGDDFADFVDDCSADDFAAADDYFADDYFVDFDLKCEFLSAELVRCSRRLS